MKKIGGRCVERAAGDGAYGRADPISCIVRHCLKKTPSKGDRHFLCEELILAGGALNGLPETVPAGGPTQFHAPSAN